MVICAILGKTNDTSQKMGLSHSSRCKVSHSPYPFYQPKRETQNGLAMLECIVRCSVVYSRGMSLVSNSTIELPYDLGCYPLLPSHLLHQLYIIHQDFLQAAICNSREKENTDHSAGCDQNFSPLFMYSQQYSYLSADDGGDLDHQDQFSGSIQYDRSITVMGLRTGGVSPEVDSTIHIVVVCNKTLK